MPVDLTKANKARMAEVFGLFKGCLEGIELQLARKEFQSKELDDEVTARSDVACSIRGAVEPISEMGLNLILSRDDVPTRELCFRSSQTDSEGVKLSMANRREKLSHEEAASQSS